MLNERDIEAEIEGENLRISDEQVKIGPNWEKVYKMFYTNIGDSLIY